MHDVWPWRWFLNALQGAGAPTISTDTFIHMDICFIALTGTKTKLQTDQVHHAVCPCGPDHTKHTEPSFGKVGRQLYSTCTTLSWI